MSSRHVSLRIDSTIFDQLENRSRQLGQTRSHLAQCLLDEGLRMEAHPGITFRSGPAGRRPGIVGGPDVWEVARIFQAIKGAHKDVIKRTVQHTGLSAEQVRIALKYYAEYKDEIDQWIQRADEEADRAETMWQRQQGLVA